MGEYPYVNTIIRQCPNGKVEGFHDFDNDGKFDLWNSYSSIRDFSQDINGMRKLLTGSRSSPENSLLRIDDTEKFLHAKNIDRSRPSKLDTFSYNNPLVIKGQKIFKKTLDECLKYRK